MSSGSWAYRTAPSSPPRSSARSADLETEDRHVRSSCHVCDDGTSTRRPRAGSGGKLLLWEISGKTHTLAGSEICKSPACGGGDDGTRTHDPLLAKQGSVR